MSNFRINELRRRVENDPASIAFAQLAEEYRRAGACADAVQVCRAGLERHPTYLSARVTLGRSLLELGRYDEAQRELEFVMQSSPENLAAVRTLAEVHQRRGTLAEALRLYQRAAAIAPHDPELEDAVSDLQRRLGTGEPHDAPREDEAPGAPDRGDQEQPQAAPPLESQSPPMTLASLSPDLEAAADEFTRALEALDALMLNLPPAPGGIARAPVDDREINALQDAFETGTPPVASPPDPDTATLAELESWLDAILRDREERARRRAASGRGSSPGH